MITQSMPFVFVVRLQKRTEVNSGGNVPGKQTMLTEVEWHQSMGNNNQREERWKENGNYLYMHLLV